MGQLPTVGRVSLTFAYLGQQEFPWPISFVQSSSAYVLCRASENEITLWDLYRTSCKIEQDGEFVLIFNNYDLLN